MTDLRFSPKLLYISKHKNKALEQGSHTVWKQCQYYERIFKNAVIYFNLEVYCRKLQDLDFKEIGLKNFRINSTFLFDRKAFAVCRELYKH